MRVITCVVTFDTKNMFSLSVALVVIWICYVRCDQYASYPVLSNSKTATSLDDQKKAVEQLMERKLGERAKHFLVYIDPNIGPNDKNTFKVNTNNSVFITGNNAISASWGFHYYLTKYAGAHISWDGEWINIPSKWPSVPRGEISIISNDKFRYMANMCTFSYSYQWYDWPSWEKHIDWMALNAINLPLAAVGQEEIWRKVFIKFGFSAKEIEVYLTGPAFLSWNRMGNIKNWGGPISSSWLKDQASLNKKILKRMRSLSMFPVVPSFAGFVPEGISRIYPNTKLHKLPSWNKFNDSYSSNLLLDSEDPLFEKIGTEFLKEYKREFGTDHFYSADIFNEMKTFRNPSIIASYGKAVFNVMQIMDEHAIWVMQGWIFQDTIFWTQLRAKSLLTSVPKGRMIVLDLYAEEQPRYSVYKFFYGQPFIWCMLHNFGGKSGFYGAVDFVNEGPLTARHARESTMVGIGIAPEAIDQNYVIYEFMLEHTWVQGKRDIDSWIAGYTKRRYGTSDNKLILARKKLMHSVYNFTLANRLSGPSYTSRPNLHMKPTVCKHLKHYWYKISYVFEAWDIFIKYTMTPHLQNSLLKHDLVDLSREAMAIIIMEIYQLLIDAYHAGDTDKFRYFNQTFIMAITDLDSLLKTDAKFLLGRWISDAKRTVEEVEEKDRFEFNARNQLTLWGPDGNVLDYAAKQWSGLIESYYLKRWKLFTKDLVENWDDFNQTLFDKKVFKEVEMPFCLDKTTYPSESSGDAIKKSILIYQKYRHIV